MLKVSIAVAVTCVKLLLVPAYHSTDFDVHRNWLAITHSLPVREWYREATSQWTLDYPPFFAYFEALLSMVVGPLHGEMVRIVPDALLHTLEDPLRVKVLHRLTVIASDLLLLRVAARVCNALYQDEGEEEEEEEKQEEKRGKTRTGGDDASMGKWQVLGMRKSDVAYLLVVLNPGLLLVDHVHFQYNGMLMAVFLLAILAIEQQRNVWAALWFAVLLNLKHLFLYVAPAFFVYLLRVHVMGHPSSPMTGLFHLAAVVLTVFGVSVLPIILLSQPQYTALNTLLQLKERLFPVQRGLCHAFWAPNVWALYNMADKAAGMVSTRLLGRPPSTITAGMTGGLVGTEGQQHAYLPSPQVSTTLALVLLALLPLLWRVLRTTASQLPRLRANFVHLCTASAFAFYLFSWHVHEKAVLTITVPLSVVALRSQGELRQYALLSAVGHFSLFPLLHQSAETPFKLAVYVCYHALLLLLLHNATWRWALLAAGLLLLQLFYSLIHPLFIAPRLPFLPLLSISVACALVLVPVGFRALWSIDNNVRKDE